MKLLSLIEQFTLVGTIIDCSSNGLTEIPDNLPVYTTDLDLSGNKIKVLPRHAFSHMPELYKLDLANNKISNIEENAFHGVTKLSEL